MFEGSAKPVAAGVTRLVALTAAVSLALAACAPAAPPSPAAAPAKAVPTAAPPPKAAAQPTTAPAKAAEKPAAQPTAAPAAKPAGKPAQAVSKVSLKSAYTTTSATMAPLWGGEVGKFFEEEGLDITLSRIQAGAPILAAMRSGDVPLAFVGAQQIVEADLQGGDFVLVAGFVDKLTQQIYVDPSIERPEQLEGKALGVTNFGAITHVAGQVAMQHLNMADKVTFLATGGPPETLAAMQAGRIAGAAFSPPEAFRARDAGFRMLLDLTKIDAPSQSSSIATTKQYAKEHPDIVERYVRAAIKGSHKIRTDRAFGLEAVLKYTKLEDPKVLEETYDFYKEVWGKDGFPSLRGLQQNLDLAAEKIPAAKDAKPEQFVDLTFVNNIKASGLLDELWGKGNY